MHAPLDGRLIGFCSADVVALQAFDSCKLGTSVLHDLITKHVLALPIRVLPPHKEARGPGESRLDLPGNLNSTSLILRLLTCLHP
jgi:hypothetical protein